MLSSFWSSLHGKLGERLVAAVFSPAAAFWLGGLLAWGWHEIRPRAAIVGYGQAIAEWARPLEQLPAIVTALLLAGTLGLILASGLVAQRLSLTVLRLLEGYWPRVLGRITRALTAARGWRIQRRRTRWLELERKGRANLSPVELRKLAALDLWLREVPGRPELRMPTRLGDLLRSAEVRPSNRYGLDAFTCWPRLWLVLPEVTRAEIGRARERLDGDAQLLFWGFAFLVWTVQAWWALPVGLLVAVGAYRALLGDAHLYTTLVTSAYDLYRVALYEALCWPRPKNPAEEPVSGAQLTRYIDRGASVDVPDFVPSQE